MKIERKVGLYKVVENWLNAECENEEWPTDVYVPENLSCQMADAAALVYDAAVHAQRFAEEQSPRPV